MFCQLDKMTMPMTAAAAESHPVDARDRVRAEITLRGWSDRAASIHAGFSNTVLNVYFRTNRVGPTLRSGLARAFGWELNWPENPPPLPEAREDQLLKLIAELALEVRELATEVRELRCELRGSR